MELKHILTPGWESQTNVPCVKDRSNKFFADLEREVFQMKYQRLLANAGLDQDERLPIVNIAKSTQPIDIIKKDDTGSAFADLTIPHINKTPSIKIQSSNRIWNGVTVDNFYVQTKGVFYRIDEVPEGYVSIFRSKGSEYFTNAAKTKVVRVSDHWGYFIKNCDWFLRMQPGERIRRMSSFTWSRRHENKKFIGIIDLNDLSYNDHYSRPPRTKKPI